SLRTLIRPRLWAVCAVLFTAPSLLATTVWSGYTKTFTKANGADDTLPANQDLLTSGVIFTRGGSGGLINFVADPFFNSSSSPGGTLWATSLNNPAATVVDAAHHADLATWEPWF